MDAIGIINGVLGTSENSLLNFTFGPNPASETVTVNSEKIGTIRILDLNGNILQELQHNTQTTIHLDQIQKGIYLIQLEVDGIRASERLILQ